jgi:membrane protein DedA with SNARE-associated domain
VHFSTDVLNHILATWGYLAVFLFVGIDAAGIPFPGETMLIVAAIYAGTGALQIPIVIAAAALGAFVGFDVSYIIGRTGGRAFILRFGKYVRLDINKIERAEEFFEKYGNWAIFLGRFVSVGRAWAALLAGLNRMPWPTFLIFNAASAVVWALLFGVLGFELGHNLPLLHRVLRIIGIAGVVALAVVVIVIVLLQLQLRRRREEQTGGKTSVKGEP